MDFRAYVQQKAPALYNYVGNDGGIDAPKVQSQLNAGGMEGGFAGSNLYGYTNVDQVRGTVNDLYAQYNYDQGAANNRVTTPTAPKVDANFVNQAYDTKIAGLRSVLDTLQPQQDAATLNVNNQYQNQANTLTTQKAQGERNLKMASEQVQDSKAKSLDDLRRQVETMGMSYNNQLGAYGAGDSSAAQMLQQALGGMASRNRGNVMDNAARQDQAITLQGQDLELEFNNNMKSLDDWKSSSLNDIATKFLQQRQAIQQQMVGADADRYQALAQADAAYTNQAIAQLANLENVYRSNAQDLIGRYQSIQGPQVGIAENLRNFAVQPISAGQVAQVGAIPGVAPSTDPTPMAYRRPFQEDYGFSLQGF